MDDNKCFSLTNKLGSVLYLSGGLKFGDFTLKSGRKSPYFINSGKTIETGSALNIIISYFIELIDTNIGWDNVDVIYGPAYKGLPLASGIAGAVVNGNFNTNIRWAHDRKEMKLHGDSADKLITGTIKPNDRVLIVDDVITDAGTKLEAIDKLLAYTNNKVTIMGIAVIVDRQECPKEALATLEKAGGKIYSISTITDVLLQCLREGFIKCDILDKCKTYISQYSEG